MLILRTKRYWIATCVGACLYAVLTVLANASMGAGESLWILAFAPILSPVSVFSVLTPVIPMAIVTFAFLPLFYSSFRQWWLIRANRRIGTIIVIITVCGSGYLIIGYPLAVLCLKFCLHGYRVFPEVDGIVSWLGISNAIGLLLLVSVLVSISIALLTFVIAFWCSKGWQTLSISMLIYVVAPMLLIIPGVLPESWMPVNVYYRLLSESAPRIGTVAGVMTYIVGILITCGLLVFWGYRRECQSGWEN